MGCSWLCSPGWAWANISDETSKKTKEWNENERICMSVEILDNVVLIINLGREMSEARIILRGETLNRGPAEMEACDTTREAGA